MTGKPYFITYVSLTGRIEGDDGAGGLVCPNRVEHSRRPSIPEVHRQVLRFPHLRTNTNTLSGACETDCLTDWITDSPSPPSGAGCVAASSDLGHQALQQQLHSACSEILHPTIPYDYNCTLISLRSIIPARRSCGAATWTVAAPLS